MSTSSQKEAINGGLKLIGNCCGVNERNPDRKERCPFVLTCESKLIKQTVTGLSKCQICIALHYQKMGKVDGQMRETGFGMKEDHSILSVNQNY